MTPPPRTADRVRVRRRAAGGFTLIELTVSLLAGLLVAIAIVGLSKESTRSFHEEVRASAAEAALRTAADRLRADIARASFMMTPNIVGDPKIAFVPGGPHVSTTLAAAYPGIGVLQGIHLSEGSSNQNTALGLSLSGQNGTVAPDVLEIGGNMTGAEQFEVQAIVPAASNAQGGAGATCTQILLSTTSPAIFRILNSPDAGGAPSAGADQEMRNLFQPVSQSNSTNQFLVRIVDDTGCSQYLPTCKAQAKAAGLVAAAGGPLAPFVLVDGAPLTAKDTQGRCGLQGNSSGHAWVNPVQVVRWEIVGPTAVATEAEPTQVVAGLDNQWTEAGAQDPNKYDLMRMFLDATGAVVPETKEIIAEYAVDFDVAFTVDTSVDTTGAAPSLVTYDFDTAGQTSNQAVADVVTVAGTKPQRIRSVRARLVTRTAQADRTVNIPLTDGGVPYMYRYCIQTAGCSGTTALQWARTRTVTMETSIPNQATAFF